MVRSASMMLGHTIRHGSRRWGTLAGGAALGLLVGLGLYSLAADAVWHGNALGWAIIAGATTTGLLAVGVTVTLYAARRSGKWWTGFIGAAVVVGCLVGYPIWIAFVPR